MLTVNNLSITFPNHTSALIRNAFFELPAGAFCYLSGESGSGKSALCLALSGMLIHARPEACISGEITFINKPILHGQFRNDIAITLENPYAQLTGIKRTVLGELQFGLEMRGVLSEEIIRRADAVARQFGLDSLVNRDPRTLSGGETQKLILASSYVLEPKLWILDRPFTELDPGARTVMLNMLKQLAYNGSTILLSEEPSEDILSSVTHTLSIDSGRVQLHTEHDSLIDFSTENMSTTKPLINYYISRSKSVVQNPDRLRVNNVTFRYSLETPLIENVSFEMKQGECLWISGGNGSGKTTLAKLISGILKPTTGHVFINNDVITGMPLWKIAHKVAYSFQNPDIQIFSQTVYNEVAYGPKAMGYNEHKCRELTEEMLDRFDLSDKALWHPHDLNRSEKKRLGLAATFAMDTLVIVLDEPTNYLNAYHKESLHNCVNHFIDRKIFIVITHDNSLPF